MTKNRKNQIILIFGNITTRIGSVAYSIALSLWILEISGSAKILGNVKTISYIPMILLNLFSGYIADTYNKKNILIITDLINAIMCLVFYFLGDNYYQSVVLIVILNVIIAINSTIFSPSLRALLPEVVGKENIKKTNAILTNFSELSKIVVPLVVVFLFEKKILTFGIMLLFNGLTFIISAISECFISYKATVTISKSSKIKNILEGFQYLYNNKKFLILILYTLFLNVGLIIFELFIPYYFKVVINKPLLLGLALSLESIGAIISSTIIIIIKENKYITLKNSIIALSLSFLFILINSNIAVNVASFFIGFFCVMFNVLLFTNIQENIKKEYLGRVVSTVYFISSIGMPIGSFLFSILFSFNNSISIYILIIYIIIILLGYVFFDNKYEN